MSYEKIGKYAAVQAVSEVGLGSLLHALHVPLTGHFLSLNQCLILTLAAKQTSSRRECISVTSGISSVAACLKALSPIGQRLSPMLGISMQGFLFALGVGVFGRSLAGILVGAALLSVWTFLQPLLLAYLLFGRTFFEAIERLWREMAHGLRLPEASGLWILAAVVALKFLLGAGVSIAAWLAGPSFEEKYLAEVDRLRKRAPDLRRAGKKGTFGAVAGAFRDILSPWFLISLALSVGFFAFSGHSGHAEASRDAILYGARVLVVGWFCFWGIRAFPISWARKGLKRFPGLEHAANRVFESTRPRC